LGGQLKNREDWRRVEDDGCHETNLCMSASFAVVIQIRKIGSRWQIETPICVALHDRTFRIDLLPLIADAL
jgi:hypothetical protein